MTDTLPAQRPTRRSPRAVVLLHPVPGRSAIHELWAGTKLIVVFSLSVLLTVYPGWIVVVLGAVLVLAAAWIAHIPPGAVPSVPRWLWIWLIIGGLIAVLAGGSPVIQMGTVALGVGGLLSYLRFAMLTIVLLGLGAMVSWTTNVAEIAPAIAVLGRPLRWLRIPVDGWAAAVGLALRAFPMLIDEFRVLFAARKLRPKQPSWTRRALLRRLVGEVIDLVVAIVTVTLRRADEMGDAITARGGAGQISAAPSRPKPADWIALAISAAVCLIAVAAQLMSGS